MLELREATEDCPEFTLSIASEDDFEVDVGFVLDPVGKLVCGGRLD